MRARAALLVLLLLPALACAKGGHGGRGGGHSSNGGSATSSSKSHGGATHSSTVHPVSGRSGNCANRDEHGNCVSYGARAPEIGGSASAISRPGNGWKPEAISIP